MNVEQRPDGTAVLTTSSLDELVEFSKRNDKRELEELRPVLVLNIDDPVRSDGVGRDRMPDGPTLARSIALAGHYADHAHIQSASSVRQEFDFPRRLSWKELPTLVRPLRRFESWSPDRLSAEGFRDNGGARIAGLTWNRKAEFDALVREKVKAIVVASHEPLDEYVHAALKAFDDVPDGDLPTVVRHGPEGGDLLTAAEVARIRDRFRAEDRFVYNHALNYSVLSGRAMFKIAHDHHLSRYSAKTMIRSVSKYGWMWAHPLFLQILHLLKREGRVGTHEHRNRLEEVFPTLTWASLFTTGLPIFERNGESFDLVWKGSGSYPEWRMNVGRVWERPDDPRGSNGSISHHRIFECFRHVHLTGLLGLDGDQIVLSPYGVQFLDILGPKTDDQDVLLRWRTPSGEMGSSDDIPAMDRWLNRTFRAVKRRVAAMEHDFSLLDDGVIEQETIYRRELTVFGARIDLTDEDFLDPVLAAEVARIAQTEATTALKDRRAGLIHEPVLVGRDPKVLGVWFGTPIAVTYLDVLFGGDREHGWLKDFNGVMPEAVKNMEDAHPALRDRLGDVGPSLVHHLATNENPCEFVKLKWAVPHDPDDVIVEIIHGVVSAIDLNDTTLPEGVRMYLSSGIPQGLGEHDCQDGLRQRVSKTGHATVSCGLFVGLYNQTKGISHIVPSVSAVRRRRFDASRLSLIGNAGHCFALNTSEQAHWALLTDGTAKRIDGGETASLP